MATITVSGTSGDENLDLSFLSDDYDVTAYMRGGNDVIKTGAGDDKIWLGPGDDMVESGAGEDVIRGRAGQDTINAGEDADVVYFDVNDLVVDGGEGVSVPSDPLETPSEDYDTLKSEDNMSFRATPSPEVKNFEMIDVENGVQGQLVTGLEVNGMNLVELDAATIQEISGGDLLFVRGDAATATEEADKLHLDGFTNMGMRPISNPYADASDTNTYEIWEDAANGVYVAVDTDMQVL